MEKAEYIAQQRALLDRYEGSTTVAAPPADTPAGFTRVTAPNGASRLYPNPVTIGLPADVGAWGYAQELAHVQLKRPDGTLYCEAWAAIQFAGQTPPLAEAAVKAGEVAKAVDQVMYQADWLSQAERDQAAKIAAAQQGAQWLPGQQQSAAGVIEQVPDDAPR